MSEQTLPTIVDEAPESVMEFVLARFLTDLRCRLQNALEEKLTVAFTTHTEYFDADRKRFVCEPPASGEDNDAPAEVPSISLGEFTWERNSVVFKDDFTYTPCRFEDCQNDIIDGFKKGNPVEILNVGITVKLFHEHPNKLLNLQRRFFQYFDLHPYLFIPLDFANRAGVTDDWLLNELKKQWFAFPIQDLDVPGFFVKQGIPIDAPTFTSSLTASTDNLFVAGSQILVEDVPVADGLDLGNFELFRAAKVDIFTAKPGEDFEDVRDNVASKVEIGEFKECE